MKTHHIRLIDSTYSANDAHEVLMSLIKDKIRFLRQKIFSLEERFGSDTDHLKKRVQELTEEKRTLELILEQYDGENVEIQIGCTVSMNIHSLVTE